MSRVRALLLAQGRATWNQVRREAGVAGAATAIVLPLVLSVALVGPSWGSFTIGRALGDELELEGRAGKAAAALGAIETSIVAALALLGATLAGGAPHVARALPHLPLGPRARLAIHVGARALEPLGLLGLCCTTGLAVGAAGGRPTILPWALAHAACAWLTMLLLLHVVSQVRLMRRQLLVLGGAAATAAAALAGRTRAEIDEALSLLPSVQGYAALGSLLRHESATSVWRAGVPWAILAALSALAALSHRTHTEGDRPARTAETAFSFRSQRAGVGRLWASCVTSHRAGRVLLGLPAMLGCSLAVVIYAIGDEPAIAEVLPVPNLESAPVVGLLLAATPLFLSEIWANQFGWLGSALRTLLGLPVDTRTLLTGLLAGHFRVLALALPLAVVPVALVKTVDPLEVLWGLLAAAVVLLWMAALGHVVSARFPRRIAWREPHVPRASPLSMLATSATSAAALAPTAIVWIIATWMGRFAVPVAMLLLLAASLAAYRVALPVLCEIVDGERERLASAS